MRQGGELEVQYRLMHDGDGLALWELNEVEFEALTNDAILLILEVPPGCHEVSAGSSWESVA